MATPVAHISTTKDDVSPVTMLDDKENDKAAACHRLLSRALCPMLEVALHTHMQPGSDLLKLRDALLTPPADSAEEDGAPGKIVGT